MIPINGSYSMLSRSEQPLAHEHCRMAARWADACWADAFADVDELAVPHYPGYSDGLSMLESLLQEPLSSAAHSMLHSHGPPQPEADDRTYRTYLDNLPSPMLGHLQARPLHGLQTAHATPHLGPVSSVWGTGAKYPSFLSPAVGYASHPPAPRGQLAQPYPSTQAPTNRQPPRLRAYAASARHHNLNPPRGPPTPAMGTLPDNPFNSPLLAAQLPNPHRAPLKAPVPRRAIPALPHKPAPTTNCTPPPADDAWLVQLPSLDLDAAAAAPAPITHDLLSSILLAGAAHAGGPTAPQPRPSTHAVATYQQPLRAAMPTPMATEHPAASSPCAAFPTHAMDASFPTHAMDTLLDNPTHAMDTLLDNPTYAMDALLDNPLNAALLTAQLPKPPRASSPLAPQSQPIAKPKRKKLRPRDTLNSLQSHVDTITAQINRLSLQNRRLQMKHSILQHVVQELDRYEAEAAQTEADLAHHRAHPSEPPQGAAAYQQWTPQQFADFYNGHVGVLARLMVVVESGTAPAGRAAGCTVAHPTLGCMTPAAAAALSELEDEIDKLLQVVLRTCHGRPDFLPNVITLIGRSCTLPVSEEQHWKNVVAAMELTEGQVEEMLVAREVFVGMSDRLKAEQGLVQAAICQCSNPPASGSSEGAAVDELVELEEQVVRRMAAVLNRYNGIILVNTMFIISHIFNPVQMARCIVNAHPLLARLLVIMNVLHAQHSPAAPAASLLSPPASNTATT